MNVSSFSSVANSRNTFVSVDPERISEERKQLSWYKSNKTYWVYKLSKAVYNL